MATLTVRSRNGWPRLAGWCLRVQASVKPVAAAVLQALVGAVVALRGLAGLVLISYGAWLAYRPAGFVVAGVLLLADRVLDERSEPPR